MVLRLVGIPGYQQNLLHAPVSANQQVYVGERPYESTMLNPILTMDLRQLHLKEAQLNISTGLQWVSWNPAGPRAVTLSSLYFYKNLAESRIEIKTGYLSNNFEFLGLQVGGSVATGAQGVYAVLPYEVGMSYFPLATPALNLKWNGPAHVYAKTGIQRAVDAAGGPATIARNSSGVRFIPKGDKLVTIFEGGYNRDATAASRETWVRAGYLRNTTQYPNSLTGGTSSGNYCAFLLADRQFIRKDGTHASHGVYAGASAMIAPADMNVYTQYYEARAYVEGPFRTRPFDMISLVATRSAYSRDSTRNLAAQGKTVWHNSSSITGSYTVRAARGTYISMGLSYQTGPAVTPHVPNALTAILQSSLFF
jgi:porin